MFGKLDAEEIERFLKKHIVGRIGCYADGRQYVVPVSYAYDGEYVYVHTREGMKVQMMRKNNAVCFEVDEMDNMASWKSVIAWGKFEELTSPDDRQAGIQVLMDRILPVISSETMHITPHWPFPADDVNEVGGIVFRIRLEEKTGRYERTEARK